MNNSLGFQSVCASAQEIGRWWTSRKTTPIIMRIELVRVVWFVRLFWNDYTSTSNTHRTKPSTVHRLRLYSWKTIHHRYQCISIAQQCRLFYSISFRTALSVRFQIIPSLEYRLRSHNIKLFIRTNDDAVAAPKLVWYACGMTLFIALLMLL